MRSTLPSLLLLFSSAAVAIQAQAQGIVLLGDNASARRCYQAAELAATSRLASQEDIDQCSIALDHGSLKSRDRVATLVNRGVLYSAQENYTAARRDYDRALKIPSHGGEVYANIGNLDFMLQNFDAALEHYAKAIAMGMPRVHVAHVNRGMVYEQTGRFQAALNEYQTAKRLAPEWPKPIELIERVNRKIASRSQN